MSTTPTSERIAVDWLRDGRRVVGATLVETIGSAPLDPGAQMLIDDRINIEGSVTGGFSVIMLIKNAPHPHAAQLLANWFGTAEAQTIYETQMMETSLRTDIKGTNVPEYVRPKPGVAYPVDDYSFEHYSKVRMPAVQFLQQVLQR